MKADRFREIRMKFEMNQEQFAELLGLSGFKAVSNIETGVRNPSQLTANLLEVLDGLSEKRAMEIIDLLIVQENRK